MKKREAKLIFVEREATDEEIKDGYLDNIDNSDDAFMAVKEIADSGIEKFICIYLDAENKQLVKQTICKGSVNQVNPLEREIMRWALLCDAVGIIIAHNHPSGNPNPSKDDKVFTQSILDAGKLLDIAIKDHLIVAKDLKTNKVKYYSFKQHGHLDEVKRDE